MKSKYRGVELLFPYTVVCPAKPRDTMVADSMAEANEIVQSWKRDDVPGPYAIFKNVLIKEIK